MNVEMQSMTDTQKKVLCALGFLIIVVLLHLFVVEPMKEEAASASVKAAELNRETDRRINMVKKILPMREEIAALDQAIGPVTNHFVLHREFGSYPVQRKLYEYASDGVKIVRFNEIGRRRISDPVFAAIRQNGRGGRSDAKTAAPVPCYDRYQAELSLKGGYEKIMAFLRTLERENPLFSVVSLEIIGNHGEPENHDVLMTLEWPVDAPPPPPAKPKK